jgi:polysaccharide pyruvyl transferase WcaK-like protein
MRNGFLLAGYFGFGNAGDDLIAQTVRAAVPAGWTTLGVDASRWNPFSLVSRFRRARALVYGGGELFQTRTSRRSLAYYAALPRLARACGARFVAYGMGLDPSLSGPALAAARSTLDLAARLWFRDEDSLYLYRRAGGRAPVSVVPDPVWTLPPPSPAPTSRGVLWIPRSPADPGVVKRLSAGAPVLFLHPAQDAKFFRSSSPNAFVGDPGSPQDDGSLLGFISTHAAVVSMRYHGLLLAALAGRPAVAWPLHPKVEALARELRCPILKETPSPAEVDAALRDAAAEQPRIAARAAALRAAAARGLEELKVFLSAL